MLLAEKTKKFHSCNDFASIHTSQDVNFSFNYLTANLILLLTSLRSLAKYTVKCNTAVKFANYQVV